MAAAFDRAWDYLRSRGTSRWLLRLANGGVVLSHLALLALALPVIDLLANGGRVPTFAELSPARQEEFRDRWAKLDDADRGVAARQVGLGTPEKPRLSKDPNLPTLDDVRSAEAFPGESLRSTLGEELRWRGYVWNLIRVRVGDRVADGFQSPVAAAEALPVPPPGRGDRRDYGVLGGFVRRDRSWLGTLEARAASAFPWLLPADASSDPSLRWLSFLALVAVMILSVNLLCRLAANRVAASMTLDAITRLRRAMYHHATRLGSLTLRPGAVDEALEVFTDRLEHLREALYARLTSRARLPWLLVGVLLLALAFDPLLAIGGFFLVVTLWLVGGQAARLYRDRGRRASKEAERHLGLLGESMRMMRLVKGYLMEGYNQTRVERQLDEYTEAHEQRYRGEQVAQPMLGYVVGLGAVATLYVAGAQVLRGEVALAPPLAVALAYASLAPAILGNVFNSRLIRRGEGAAARVFEFLDRRSDQARAVDASFLPGIDRGVECIDLRLDDPDTGEAILQGLDLVVKAREHVAIVGTNPREVQALLSLIPRFFEPTDGTVQIDGKDVGWLTTESLRAQVGIVFQEMLVFNDTAANNIGLGDPAYPLMRVLEAAKVTHAHQRIQRLDYGYETPIGDQSRSLELGLSFQIALTRALLRNPALYLIEEPADALDDDTQLLLEDAYRRMLHKKTVIFHSYRPITLRACDRVILIHRGRVEAVGTHEELLKASELYRRRIAKGEGEVLSRLSSAG